MAVIGKTGPDPVDVHVGAFLRARRKRAGASQSDLAKALGLTFQQVQKYERGVNRISASKLYAACRYLGCEPGAAFDGLPEVAAPETAPDPVLAFAGCPGATQIASAYPRLDTANRTAVLAVVRAGMSHLKDAA